MSSTLKAKPSDLAKAWSLVRSSDLRQMTVRLPSETFIKIQALEAMFPQRSRNEMVSDLLATALDEFVDGLPFEIHQGHFLGTDHINGEPVYEEIETGLRMRFVELVNRLRSEGSEEKPKLEAVQIDEKSSIHEPKEAA